LRWRHALHDQAQRGRRDLRVPPHANGGYILDYNLYTDPNRMVVWGDGISGVTVSGSGTGSTVDHPVYGRIPGGQTGAYIGSYSDTITVTLSF
jgi:spore coat protein U-like protein